MRALACLAAVLALACGDDGAFRPSEAQEPQGGASGAAGASGSGGAGQAGQAGAGEAGKGGAAGAPGGAGGSGPGTGGNAGVSGAGAGGTGGTTGGAGQAGAGAGGSPAGSGGTAGLGGAGMAGAPPFPIPPVVLTCTQWNDANPSTPVPIGPCAEPKVCFIFPGAGKLWVDGTLKQFADVEGCGGIGWNDTWLRACCDPEYKWPPH